ncbi:MAG: hypothetical protein AB1757_04475 [Acidobacteriota bacterium]
MNSEKAFTINVLSKNAKAHAEIVERDFYAEDFRTFLVLREVLDIFQRRMIDYYLAGETVEERNARAAEIEKGISAIPNEIWMIDQLQCHDDGDCPDGQRCLDGVCQAMMQERAKALKAFAQSGSLKP